jgi:hypothetical protein
MRVSVRKEIPVLDTQDRIKLRRETDTGLGAPEEQGEQAEPNEDDK